MAANAVSPSSLSSRRITLSNSVLRDGQSMAALVLDDSLRLTTKLSAFSRRPAIAPLVFRAVYVCVVLCWFVFGPMACGSGCFLPVLI